MKNNPPKRLKQAITSLNFKAGKSALAFKRGWSQREDIQVQMYTQNSCLF